ncbi:ABC transporter permease [Clostridium sp. MB40-C1]|uniref:ABC transporter permease n=1 Tax=Clostridium sp. MB40-C1 TaxID=3070996 RepID=UPI0027E14561|nr:ABC transporter permease [Clostridium sp. MB40-C1]WMJ79737.1 ABC transporter permease [Clostridium sp. MB40-C1]
MRKKLNNSCNIIFVGIISVLTAFLLGLILSSIGIVLIKGLPNLKTSFESPEIRFALRLSIYTSIISTSFCILFAVPIAYCLVRFDFWGKRIVNTIIDIPMALPPNVAGISLLIFFSSTAFGEYLEGLGLSFVFTQKGIILAQFFINVPYMIRILKSTIGDIDPRIEFVSRTLGCSRAQSFFKVTLPLAKNGLTASIVITWARALGAFGAVLMIAGATRMKTETLPVSLYLNLSCGDLEAALSVATILIIISVLSLVIFELLGSKEAF